jgi:hypothetical protein
MHKISTPLKNTISGGEIVSICQDSSTGTIDIELKPQSGGAITVEIPRSIADPRMADCSDDRFMVWIHDMPSLTNDPWTDAKYSVKSSDDTRILKIQFGPTSTDIAITGSTGIMNKITGETCGDENSYMSNTKKCKYGFVGMIKPTGSSICVKPTTAKILESRWTEKVTVEKIDTKCNDPWDNNQRAYEIFDELSLNDPDYDNLDASDRFAMQARVFEQFIEERGVKVFDTKLRMDVMPPDSCSDCECNTGGHAWQFVISSKDLMRMQEMGFNKIK